MTSFRTVRRSEPPKVAGALPADHHSPLEIRKRLIFKPFQLRRWEWRAL